MTDERIRQVLTVAAAAAPHGSYADERGAPAVTPSAVR